MDEQNIPSILSARIDHYWRSTLDVASNSLIPPLPLPIREIAWKLMVLYTCSVHLK